jgi:hypothetical protein
MGYYVGIAAEIHGNEELKRIARLPPWYWGITPKLLKKDLQNY